MSEQYLFNFDDDGRSRKYKGLERVDDSTPSWYKTKFWEALYEFVNSNSEINPEDVRERCGDPPNSPNAFSNLWHQAVMWKIIYYTGKSVPARRPTAQKRGGGIKIYRGVRNA
jgi:hypothetical protein